MRLAFQVPLFSLPCVASRSASAAQIVGIGTKRLNVNVRGGDSADRTPIVLNEGRRVWRWR